MWNKLSMKDRAEYIKLGVANGITSLDEIRSTYNKYAEGGEKDSWKPWYWFTPEYEGNNLKEVIFKAYDDGREGKNIMYNGKAYKAELSDSDLKEYKTKKQHELNKSITNEQVVDSYIDNVLYTMENPTNAGYRKGKYYPYADISSKKNLGPGINYTSDIAKGLDFSGKKGYTKKELDKRLRPHLLENMEGIMNDLHDMYGEDIDTMSLGNRMILLDISHNVRPRGRKRGNMPKAWPSLVNGMAAGNIKKIKKNTNSGSTRRQNMRNELIFKNLITPITVTNK